jgi:uncharacterized protein YndB with AHSA1/START domain
MTDSTFTIEREELEVRTERVFDAPVERVWQAMNDPAQIPNWWGPAAMKTVVDKMDVRVGGEWRYVQYDPDGTEHGFHGEYREIDEPRKVVSTFEYEPLAGHVLVQTALYEELPDGKTKLTTIAHYDNIEDLDGMVSMGMESGQRESIDRLAALVEQV